MVTTKSNFNLLPRTFGNFMEDVFNNGLQRMIAEDAWNETAPAPVNIKESDAAYELHLMAPGFKKEEIKVNVDKNVLQISYEHKDEQAEQTGKWLRKEYKMQTFKRSFTLNDKIKAEGISAKFENGVLNVTLPKKEMKEASTQEIKIN